MMKLKNKKVGVIGLGKSGLAAARFLLGKEARVWVTEASSKPEALKKAEALRRCGAIVETGGHSPGFLKETGLVVTSPGVPDASPPLLDAKKRKIPVISEIELAAFHCPGQMIAVTGSNGKTTTSTLLHEALKGAGKGSVLCGNVGYSFLDALREMRRGTHAVVELSSFQLEDTNFFRPKISIVLNVSPNHLDRHKTFARYAEAKMRIFMNQKRGDFCILNHDDPVVRRMAAKVRAPVVFFSKTPLQKGVYFEDGKIWASDGKRAKLLFEVTDLRLQGDHNLENVLAVAAAACLLRLPMDRVAKAVRQFKTLEHRIEPVGTLRGVSFINDSKSTTVASTSAAIRAVPGPIVLVAGGRDKGADFGAVEALLRQKVKAAVLYGEAAEKIADAWKNFKNIHVCKNFPDAVKSAFEFAAAGDNLLLSPMCTSFDQFGSFEERGEAFKNVLNELKSSLRPTGPRPEGLVSNAEGNSSRTVPFG